MESFLFFILSGIHQLLLFWLINILYMRSKKQVIQVQQQDKNVPIEFMRIEDSLELFEFDHHYQFDFYQIFWFTKSDGQFQEIDFVNYPILQDEIWIIYPGQVHFFEPTTVEGYFIGIDKDYFNRILFQEVKQHAFTGNNPLSFKVTPKMHALFTHLNLLIEMEYVNLQRPVVLEKYVQLYVLHLQDLPVVERRLVHFDARIHKLLELVEMHYIAERKSEFYADKVALSVKRMNEILLLSIGKSLKQQLQDRLLLEAKRLVGYSADNIQGISHTLGFSEVSYFNRFFKKLTGQTPLDFRQDVKKVQG